MLPATLPTGPTSTPLLRRARGGLCVWAFDLLQLNGEDLRGHPLVERKRLLSDLLASDVIRYAEHFEDGVKQLQAAADNKGRSSRVAPFVTGCYLGGPACTSGSNIASGQLTRT